jgi:hypothetical protein
MWLGYRKFQVGIDWSFCMGEVSDIKEKQVSKVRAAMHLRINSGAYPSW